MYQVESANVIKSTLGKVNALCFTFLIPPTQPTHAYSCTFAVEECHPYPRQVCDTIYKKHCEKVLPNHIIAIIITIIINTIIAIIITIIITTIIIIIIIIILIITHCEKVPDKKCELVVKENCVQKCENAYWCKICPDPEDPYYYQNK